jgi:hypothetical protein
MLVLGLSLVACAGAPPEGPSTAAFDHDHAAFAAVLDGAVTPDGRVRYGLLRQREQALDAYVEGLATAPVAGFDRAQQLALWVNAYNAITLSIVVDHPELKSIRELDGGEVWKTRTFTVAGERLTLDQLEHQKARPLTDGRVHAVLNCASVGCPPLPPRPLVGRSIDPQLDAAARHWVGTNAFKQTGDTLQLSEIFKWFSGDFVGFRESAIPGANEAQTRALWFIAKFSDDRTASRVTVGALKLAWQEYDWSLNSAP